MGGTMPGSFLGSNQSNSTQSKANLPNARGPTIRAATDPEKGPKEPSRQLNGFANVAAWSSVTGNCDKASDVYKVFHRSSTRNLLHLQSRVAAIEAKQFELDSEDFKFGLLDCDAELKSCFSLTEDNLEILNSRLLDLESIEAEIRDWEGLPSQSKFKSQRVIVNSTRVSIESSDATESTDHEQAEAHMPDQQEIDVKERFKSINERLAKLENFRNNSPRKFPPLPQDLFWGPVTDRGPRLSSGVPLDFILHKECVYKPAHAPSIQHVPSGHLAEQRSDELPGNDSEENCFCHRAYRKAQQDEDEISEMKGVAISVYDIQTAQQRLRVLEDYIRDLCTNELKACQTTSKKYFKEYRIRKTLPSLAISLATRCWEYFEIFGSAEKMWETRRTWAKTHAHQPWPFDMSDEWVGRMRERWEVAMNLQVALKEYHEAVALEASLTTLRRPAPRIIRSIGQRLPSIVEPNSQAAGNAAEGVKPSTTQIEGLESPFLLSSKGIFDDVKDLVLLPSVPPEDPSLIAWVSDTMARQRYFKKQYSSAPEQYFVSEAQITSWTTGLGVGFFIVLLLAAMWPLKLLVGLIVKDSKADYVQAITNAQLGILSVTVIIFGIFTLLLGASRLESIASTAAYAAVLVIFMDPAPPGSAT